MKLNDQQIKKAKPKEKPYKLIDGKGLYLYITPTGGKLWRLKYRVNGKEKTLSIGAYPAVTLAQAREQAAIARQQQANGIDPSQAKQQAKVEKKQAALNTFQAVMLQWHKHNLSQWKPNHAERVLRYFKNDVLPLIGSKPIDSLRVADVRAVLDNIKARGVNETAEKIRQWIGAVFKYANLLELTLINPALPLQGYIHGVQSAPMPMLPESELTTFFQRLHQSNAKRQNKIGVLLTVICFARNTEIRGAKWEEIDFQAAIWTIPAERMKHEKNKPKPPHIIPLSSWALELLNELHGLTGNTPFLFPSRDKPRDRYISENTFGKIINDMGYKGIATPHGFRSLASTILNEHGFNHDAIERQLAHIEENKVRAAYNRAEYMAERTEFMQWYSDFLQQRFKNAIQAA